LLSSTSLSWERAKEGEIKRESGESLGKMGTINRRLSIFPRALLRFRVRFQSIPAPARLYRAPLFVDREAFFLQRFFHI